MIDPEKRAGLREAAAAFVQNERSVDTAVARLQKLLARIPALAGVH